MTEDQEKWLTEELMDSMKMAENEERSARRYVKRAADKVLIYCNRKDLPEPLLNTVVQIAEDMLKADSVVKTESAVASVTRGDTAISYKDNSVSQTETVNFMKNYQSTLNRFRKMNLPRDRKND